MFKIPFELREGGCHVEYPEPIGAISPWGPKGTYLESLLVWIEKVVGGGCQGKLHSAGGMPILSSPLFFPTIIFYKTESIFSK